MGSSAYSLSLFLRLSLCAAYSCKYTLSFSCLCTLTSFLPSSNLWIRKPILSSITLPLSSNYRMRGSSSQLSLYLRGGGRSKRANSSSAKRVSITLRLAIDAPSSLSLSTSPAVPKHSTFIEPVGGAPSLHLSLLPERKEVPLAMRSKESSAGWCLFLRREQLTNC